MATVIQIACPGNLGISFCNYQFFLILAFLNKALLLLSISNPGSVVFTNVYVGTEIRSSVIKLFCRQEANYKDFRVDFLLVHFSMRIRKVPL